jgi:hypothetical protein
MHVKGITGVTAQIAEDINVLLQKLPYEALKYLGSQLGTSDREAYDVISHNKKNNGSGTLNEKSRREAGQFLQYKAYVSSMVMSNIDFHTAISRTQNLSGANKLNFEYDCGVMRVKVEDRFYPVPDAVRVTESFLKSQGQKVKVEHVTLLDKYAEENFGDEGLRRDFLQSPEKNVNNVSLSEVARMFKNGVPTGQYGVTSEPTAMSNLYRTYLQTENKQIKAYHKSAQGVVHNGTDVTKGAVFFNCGLDNDAAGVSGQLANAIAAKYGTSLEISSEEAKKRFLALLDSENMAKGSVMPFDFAWMSKAYSDAKGSPVTLEAFARNYAKILMMCPVYVGKGSFSYILIPGVFNRPLKPVTFMSLPNVVEKIVAIYAMSSTMIQVVSLQSLVEKFFSRCLNPTMNSLVNFSLRGAYGKYTFDMDFKGVGKTRITDWETDIEFSDGMGDLEIKIDLEADWDCSIPNRKEGSVGDGSGNNSDVVGSNSKGGMVVRDEQAERENYKEVKSSYEFRLATHYKLRKIVSTLKGDAISRFFKRDIMMLVCDTANFEFMEEFIDPYGPDLNFDDADLFLDTVQHYYGYLGNERGYLRGDSVNGLTKSQITYVMDQFSLLPVTTSKPNPPVDFDLM